MTSTLVRHRTSSSTLPPARARSTARTTTGALLALLLVALLVPSSAQAAPPAIPSKSTALSYLSALDVATEGSMTGYSRDEFPHWITIEGTCNTREEVLKRDGTGVTVGSDCYPTSGSWTSAYDGVKTTDPGTFDIDHVVPLAEAWRSGAKSWTTAKRQDFANDLKDSQLIAVSASSNRSKGDQDPGSWLPPSTSYRCTYAKMWVSSKHVWDLTAQQSEVDALRTLLNGCSS